MYKNMRYNIVKQEKNININTNEASESIILAKV